MKKNELTVIDVARIANCSRNTVLNWLSRGVISCERDINNIRVFTTEDALMLKSFLSLRRRGNPCGFHKSDIPEETNELIEKAKQACREEMEGEDES